MSGAGAPPSSSDFAATGVRVGLVATRWYSEITDSLLDSARAAVEETGAIVTTVMRVPGAFELPVAAQRLAASNDAVIALGLVIRGDTPHFDYVCGAATQGLTRVALDTGVPVGFGLLTCDTEDQARARSGLPGSKEDKGREAALAALETVLVLRAVS